MTQLISPSRIGDRLAQFHCPCGGVDGNSVAMQRIHTKQHMAWANGIRVPDVVTPGIVDGQMLIVRSSDKVPGVRLAYDMASLFQLAGHHDHNGFTYPTRNKSRRITVLPIMYILVYQGAAIAFATVDIYDQWREYGHPGATQQHTFGVAEVFTCASFRRQGVATLLIDAMLTYRSAVRDDLYWAMPLSHDGEAFARTFLSPGHRLRIV